MGIECGEFKHIFPTALLRRRLDAVAPLNPQLREIILEREARDPGIVASNVDEYIVSGARQEIGIPIGCIAPRPSISTTIPVDRCQKATLFQGLERKA